MSLTPILLIALTAPAHSSAPVPDRDPQNAPISIRVPTTGAADGGLHVEFTLGNGSHARLELTDVTGRVVRAQHVGAYGLGRHSVDISNGQPLPPGIYVLRLSQGKHEVRARAAVLR